MLIIGESLSSGIPRVKEAIEGQDTTFLINLAQKQREAGADVLDVNAAALGEAEVEALPWLVKTVQAAVDIPLMIDSLNARAVEAALAVHRGHAIINSLSGEEKRWQDLMPLVTKYDCAAVMLCNGGTGIPATAQERLDWARKLVERAQKEGLELEDMYLDPLVLSAGADWQAGRVTLETLRLIRRDLPEAHNICAISNVSFGLPQRRLLNASFVAMTAAMGLDTFLVDVRDKRLMATIWASNTLAGNDRYCTAYLRAYRSGQLQV